MLFYKIIATFFGIGLIGRGAGTVAAIVCCSFFYLGFNLESLSEAFLLYFIFITFFAGVFVAGKVEKSWGKDHQVVVIDEVFGMAISMVFLPINLFTVSMSFLFFRFFDIRKPLFIRKMENFKGGWGVMLDDLLAGIYANLSSHLIVILLKFYYEDIF